MVLQSARGPVPNLAEQVAGEPIRGSWWAHTSGHEIFAVLTRVLNSPDVVATRLVNGKVTLVHRRLWPALVRVADRFPAERLAAIDEEHTASGAHRTIEVPFPEWVPAEDITAAGLLTTDGALAQFPALPPLIGGVANPVSSEPSPSASSSPSGAAWDWERCGAPGQRASPSCESGSNRAARTYPG